MGWSTGYEFILLGVFWQNNGSFFVSDQKMRCIDRERFYQIVLLYSLIRLTIHPNIEVSGSGLVLDEAFPAF